MKTPLIIAISGIAFGAVGFLAGNRNSDTASSGNPENDQRTTARSMVRNTSSTKKTSSPPSRGSMRSLDDNSQRGTMANLNNILSLNARDIKELITGPDFIILDGEKGQLFRACLSRLTEIDPAMAMEVAESFDSGRKPTAIRAVFEEWSSQDAQGVTAMALDDAFGNNKKLALYYSLIELSQQDPDKALKLAEQYDITNALSSIVINMSKTDPLTALEKCSFLPSYSQKKNRSSIIKAWALKAPKEAEAFIAGIENKKEKTQLFIGLLQAVSADKAFVLLEDNIDNIDPSELETITATLVKENPSQMMAWLENLPEGNNKSRLTSKAIEHWFNVDESKAIAYYQSISNKQMQTAISTNLFNQLAYKNPKKLIELQAVIGSSKQSSYSLKRALTQLGKTDTPYAMEYLNGLTDTKQRQEAIQAILGGVADNDPTQAIATANQLNDSDERDTALASIYRKIADKDPQTIAQAFSERGMQSIGGFKVSDFVTSYAQNNLEEAKSFVDSIEDPLVWDASISKLLSVWAKNDPLEAVEFALQQEPTEGIGRAMSQIGRSLAETDPQKALSIALSEPKTSISNNMLSSVLRTWVNQDLEAAVNAMQDIPTDRTGTQVYSTVASKYAQTDADKGGQWVNSIQDANTRDRATYSLISTWLNKDPDAAVSWVENLQDGSQRDTAVKRLVSTFDGSDPIYAIEWASTLSSENSSKSLIKSTYTTWKKRDPDAANQWLNSTNLVGNEDRESWSK